LRRIVRCRFSLRCILSVPAPARIYQENC
jgi:hypothetical protein